MRMARKLRNKGLEVTCPAELGWGRPAGALDLVFWVRIRIGVREYPGGTGYRSHYIDSG